MIKILSKLLILLSFCIVLNDPVFAAKREFGTYLILGYGKPMGSSEALSTPIVIADHESSGYFLDGTLRLKYETVSPTISMTHRLVDFFDFEYSVFGTAIAEGNGSDIYINSEQQKAKTFAGDGISRMLGFHLFPENSFRFSLLSDSRQRKFYNSELIEENASYDLPEPFTENTNAGLIKWVGLLNEDGEISAKFIQGSRTDFENWKLETEAENKQNFDKSIITLQENYEWNKKYKSKLKAVSASGNNLDLFSNFKVGGMMSQYGVAGYFRNEYRVSSVKIAKFIQEVKFADDRILYFYGDKASFKTLENPNIGATAETMDIAGIGIGFHYGIRSLMGLPIIVQYGHGLNVPEDSIEKNRQELVVLLVAAF